jgi:hypothetical protein
MSSLAPMAVGRPRQTHCKRSHPLEGDNIKVINPGKYQKARRTCRTCFNMMMRVRYETDLVFRENKKRKKSVYQRNFRETMGFWPSEQYRKA